MKKTTKKKTITAVTGATVIGVAAAALVNGSKLETVFNPKKFEKFENKYNSDDYDYVAGNGEETDIAGNSKEDEEKSGGDDLQVLQLKKQENGDLKDDTSFGIAEESSNSEEDRADTEEPEEEQNLSNGIELSQPEQQDEDTSSDTRNMISPSNPSGTTNNSTQNNGNDQNGNGSGKGTGTVTGTPAPTAAPKATETPTPEPTAVPEPTQTPEPTLAPTETPAPEPTKVPEPTATPSPTPSPSPSPTPVPWEDKQLQDKDTVTTEDGQLTALDVDLTKEYYAFGETYQEGDGKVTATFLQKDGTKKKKELSYGGKDGYSVTLATIKTGRQIAVFSYKGMSARVYYTVLKNNLTLNYMASFDGGIYDGQFPGTPLMNSRKDLYDALYKYTEPPYTYASHGKYSDLTEIHRRFIAILGNEEMKGLFDDPSLGNSYSHVVFLENDADGYLTNMLEGFRWIRQQQARDSRSYIYYPIENWDEISRNVVDYVVQVPEGYKVRRVAENEGSTEYTADQVLEKYTGTDPVMTVPMGVTKICLNEKNVSVKTLEIPQSVQEIDTSTLGTDLPALENYKVAKDDELRGDFKITDGILYSKDGKTLLSVPAGKKEIEIPSTVTTLAANCLKGLSEDAVVTFKSEKAPSVKGDTGFAGTILVQNSTGDTICKNYMFAFGEACSHISFETEDGQKDRYEYSSEGPVLLFRGRDKVLAGIPQKTRGEYTVNDRIKTIGENAFAGCENLTDLVLNESVKELKEGSLLLSKRVGSVTVKNPDLIISDHLFGTPGTDPVNLKIYVPGEAYERMLKEWSDKLDPVYGEGTAEKLLYVEDGSNLYEDGAKYQKLISGGTTSYRLVDVYQKDRTAFKIKDGTTEIAAGAFEDCENLEILYIPSTVERAGDDFLSGCSSLETVVSESKELFAEKNFGAVSEAEILTAGKEFTEFDWDDGVLYGKNEEGYTLLNVPTDYSEELKVKQGTSAFYKKALMACEQVHYITILDDKSLKEIGEDCFRGCAAINGVELENCENLVSVGARAFYGCQELGRITLPKSLTTIGNQAFYNCTMLESIVADGVREIGDQAFYGCGSLMTLDVFKSVETLGEGAFYGCTGLVTVDLPDTLGSMGESCFENCTMLEKITIDGTITGISRYCFYGCRSLSSIEFKDPVSRSGSIRVIGVQAFGNCTKLESLDLSEQTSLTAIGEAAFTDCESLTTIKLPGQLTRIPDYCFRNCPNLSILQIDSPEVVQPGEKIFGDTISPYVHIWVREGMTEAYQAAYQPVLDPAYGEGTTEKLLGVINEKQEYIRGILFEVTEEGRVLKKADPVISGDYVLPEDTIRVEDDAFAGCKDLTGFATLAGSTVTLGDRCFKGCSSLNTVRILGNVPEWGEETFMDCTSLKSLVLGFNENTIIDTIGTRAFKNCTGLDSDGAIEVRAKIYNYGEECFAECINLTNVSMSAIARASIITIGAGAFRDCTSLTAFLISKLSSLTYIGDYAFANCDTLKQPSVPAGVTYVGEGCFMDCDNLQYVSFYGPVEEYPKDCFRNCSKLIRTGGTAAAFKALKRIGESAYEGCDSLTTSTSWNLGRYTSLEQIGDRAFYGCGTMSDLVINKGVVVQEVILSPTLGQIGTSAFEGCSAFTTLRLSSEQPPVFGAFSFGNMAEDFMIRVPDSQEQEDSIYKAYLEKLTELLGEEDAYRILDSFSDEAKARQTEETAREEISDAPQLEDGNTEAEEAAQQSGEMEPVEIPGELEEITSEPEQNSEETSGDPESDQDGTVQDPEEMAPEQPGEDSSSEDPESEQNLQSEDAQQTEEAKENEP